MCAQNMRASGWPVTQSVALVGLMGVGKTTIGRRLAKRLGLPFYDSDDEIEKAAGRTVKGYFQDYGEQAFRDGERRVIKRLLSGGPIVLATGGGAFVPEATREVLNKKAVTIWLKADFKINMERVNRQRAKRPLLDVEDPEAAMRSLAEARYPLYKQAHIHVHTGCASHAKTVDRVLAALEDYYAQSS